MPTISEGLIHIAGNTVLDILLRDVSMPETAATDSFGSNVQQLNQPVEAVLGGNGAASAYLLGKLGQKVMLNSNLANDVWGQLLQNWLIAANVEFTELTELASAVHVITLDSAGRRRSFYHTGSKVNWQRSLQGPTAQWFFASGYGAVDRDDALQLHQVFSELRRRGSQIMFDPSPWFEQHVESEFMQQLFAQLDCLCATEQELSFWLPADSVEDLAERALALGPAKVVIKRGAKGAFYADISGGCGEVSTQAITGANTVGAGDSFNARLIYGLCRNESLASAVDAAVHTASQIVRQGRGVLGFE